MKAYNRKRKPKHTTKVKIIIWATGTYAKYSYSKSCSINNYIFRSYDLTSLHNGIWLS